MSEKDYKINNNAPLADRLRPVEFEDFFGQDELIKDNSLLRRALVAEQLPSLIFWGPPGSGKTTLALLLASKIKADFIRFSAVTEGVADLRRALGRARENKLLEQRTILFIDEIHRWNKAQQDALLPHLEGGDIILIGATTENPSFELRSALLSRCRVIVLKTLSQEALREIIKRALTDKERGLGENKVSMEDEALELLINLSQGDARAALNILEASALLDKKITTEIIKTAAQKSHLLYNKAGEEHYNAISALHKSLRGSDENAALYWLARMLEAGEDPLYVARRLVRFASEDVGLANSRALEQAVAAYRGCAFIGMPECSVILAQLVVYLARCKKSNALYMGYQAAAKDAEATSNYGVPLHLRNASTDLMKDLGYGDGYKYSPNHNYQEEQTYWPKELGKGKKYIKKEEG
ncbi:MAG: replication-associated recombination protein A [Patescibacteria group bacterium]|nr:MAG: replication-associated recombination protein A [Patescibacteria group bacterium]